jgi:protein-tyrosine phosphatase
MNMYWIIANGIRARLGIAPRPRGYSWLSEDIASLKKEGVDVLVSALTSAETDELGLAMEQECCRSCGIEFLSFPIDDRSVPSSVSDFGKLLNSLNDLLAKGNGIAVHCRAGIGRSSLIAASLLVRSGLSVEAAFLAVENARGIPVPDTAGQRKWAEDYSLRRDSEPGGDPATN